MPRAKGQICNRGGRREGAGRKRKLTVSDRRKIVSDYFARQQEGRDFDHRRDAIIGELSVAYGVTDRMVKRCLVEFLPAVRWNNAIYGYANEGEAIQPLPARKIDPDPGWEARFRVRPVEEPPPQPKRPKRPRVSPGPDRTWVQAGDMVLTCDSCPVGRFHPRCIIAAESWSTSSLGGCGRWRARPDGRRRAAIGVRAAAKRAGWLRWGGTHKIPEPEVEFFDFGTFWRDQRGIVRIIADHLNRVRRWSCAQ